MAYSLPLTRDVNRLIGRYATGYPSDRIKDMMARVERIEFWNSDIDMKIVKWSEFQGPNRNCEIVLVVTALPASELDSHSDSE